MIGKRTMAAMERGIKTGDLRQARLELPQDANRRQVVRLVQRGQWDIALELRQHFAIDQHRLLVSRPPVNDAMAYGDEVEALGFAQPPCGRLDGGGKIGHVLRRVHSIDEGLAFDPFGAQARPRAEAVNLTLDQPA